MSWQALESVFGVTLPPPASTTSHRLMLCYIAWRQNKDSGEAFAGAKRSADDIGVSFRHARRLLDDLEAADLITVTEPAHGHTPTHYNINVERLAALRTAQERGDTHVPPKEKGEGTPMSPLKADDHAPEGTPASARGDTGAEEGGHPRPREGTPRPPKPKEPKLEPSRNRNARARAGRDSDATQESDDTTHTLKADRKTTAPSNGTDNHHDPGRLLATLAVSGGFMGDDVEERLAYWCERIPRTETSERIVAAVFRWLAVQQCKEWTAVENALQAAEMAGWPPDFKWQPRAALAVRA